MSAPAPALKAAAARHRRRFKRKSPMKQLLSHRPFDTTIDKLPVCSKKAKSQGTKRKINRPMLEMKNQPTNPAHRFLNLLIAGLACLAVSARASTFWNGTTVNFTQTITGGVG